jgi:hypothetical protein
MALTYNTTSNFAWGTFVLTPTSGAATGVGFIADDFSVTQGTWLAERNDNVGNPNGALGGITAPTGRGTLQLANANVVAPQPFDEFSRALRPGATANTWFFTEIGLPKKQRDFDVVEVTFREKV